MGVEYFLQCCQSWRHVRRAAFALYLSPAVESLRSDHSYLFETNSGATLLRSGHLSGIASTFAQLSSSSTSCDFVATSSRNLRNLRCRAAMSFGFHGSFTSCGICGAADSSILNLCAGVKSKSFADYGLSILLRYVLNSEHGHTPPSSL